MDEEHTVSQIYSGSWYEDITIEDGEVKTGDGPYSMQTEMFIEAECSCGKTFTSKKELNKHIEAVKKQQS